MAAFSLLGILAWLPRQPPGVMAGLGERMALAKRADILAVLATTVLTVASTFIVYTYLGVFLQAVAGLGPQGLAAVLLGFGLASAVGTRLGGSAADHWGARYRRCRPMVHFSDRAGRPVMSARREIVLPKVFLSHRSQIFRAVRAAIER